MKDAHFTRQERDIILWLRFLLGCFFVAGIVFTFLPNYFLNYLDSIGLVFFNFHSVPLVNPRLEIWWVLSLALMGVLIYSCFQAQFNWLRFHHVVPIIIVAKLISFLGFLALAIFHPTHFFYLVASLVDGVICFVTWYSYVQAIKSRSY